MSKEAEMTHLCIKKMELQNKSFSMIYFAAPYHEMTQF